MQVYTHWISPLKVQLDRIESEFQKFTSTFKRDDASSSSSPFEGDSGHAPLSVFLKVLVIIVTLFDYMYIHVPECNIPSVHVASSLAASDSLETASDKPSIAGTCIHAC